LLAASSAKAQSPTVDAVTSADTGQTIATSLQFSHTVGTNANRQLVVGVNIRATTGGVLPTVTSVVYRVNATNYNLVQVCSFNNSTLVRAEMWRLGAPASGTGTITVTVSAATNFVAGAISLSGVSQSTPIRTCATAISNTAGVSVTVNTNPNDLVVDVVTRNNNANLNEGAGQTKQWERQIGGNDSKVVGGGSTKPITTGTSTSMGWSTGSADNWVIVAVSFVGFVNNPTEVTMTSFDATRYDKGTVLQWRTGYEIRNLGFNLYREVAGRREKVNPGLIAGTALRVGAQTPLSAGHAYTWVDPQAAGQGEVSYWLEDVGLDGKSTWHGPFGAVAKPGKLPAQSVARLLKHLNAGGTTIQRIVSSTADAGAPAASPFALAAAKTTSNLQTQWDIAALPGLKLAVRKDGWYRVTCAELVAAGFNVAREPRFFKLYTGGQEIPIIVNGGQRGKLEPGDSIEFYGQGLDLPSTGQRTYYLVFNPPQAGLRIGAADGRPGSPSNPPSFLTTVERKDRSTYFAALNNGDADNWFGPIIMSSPVVQSLTVRHLDRQATANAQLEIALQGVTIGGAAASHIVNVQLNGAPVGAITFDGQLHQTSVLNVSHSSLLEGNNTLTFTASGGDLDISLLDYVRLTYAHTFDADVNELMYTAMGGQSVKVAGFTSPKVRVIDVTDVSQPRLLSGVVEAGAGGYTLTVASPDAGLRTFYAFGDDRLLSVAAITVNRPSTWNSTGQGADVAIITHGDFAGAVEPLAALRKSQGYSVALIDIEDLYDEFSYGAHGPQAIADFLARAKVVWRQSPRYVLLVGDASNDPRNYLGLGDHDFVPTGVTATATIEAPSDDRFVDFNGDGIPDIAIGRLPVRTAQEAGTIVRKIVGYDRSAQPAGTLFIADRNDGGDFEETTHTAESLVPAGIGVQEILRSQMDDMTANHAIIDAINRGPKIVNYVGHGSFGLWRGNLLSNADVTSLTNQQSLSFFISMTCLNGLFNDAYGDSLGEALLKAEGGAVAVWASGSLTEADEQPALDYEIVRQALSGQSATGSPLTLGEAVVRAKASVSDGDVRRSWVFLGDPLTRLK
jgi:hypothetical protein